MLLNFAHFDVEDYWFYKTDIPYTAIRPQEERNEMLLSDMKKHGSFVVSGDISGWGDEFLDDVRPCSLPYSTYGDSHEAHRKQGICTLG